MWCSLLTVVRIRGRDVKRQNDLMLQMTAGWSFTFSTSRSMRTSHFLRRRETANIIQTAIMFPPEHVWRSSLGVSAVTLHCSLRPSWQRPGSRFLWGFTFSLLFSFKTKVRKIHFVLHPKGPKCVCVCYCIVVVLSLWGPVLDLESVFCSSLL